MDLIRRLYHFTDTRNLDRIREFGGLYSKAKLREMGLLKQVFCGGNDWSEDADALFGMDGFVHLCLRDNHPMEYIAKRDGRIVEATFLEVSQKVLEIGGTLYSPGVSNKSGMAHVPIAQAHGSIDFEVLYGGLDWTNPEVKERLQAAEKCEILVPGFVPAEMIRGL
jgi:hypothetical protein